MHGQQNIKKSFRIKDARSHEHQINKMNFSFLIYSNNVSSRYFEKSEHRQEAVTLYAVYGILHASALTSC